MERRTIDIGSVVGENRLKAELHLDAFGIWLVSWGSARVCGTALAVMLLTGCGHVQESSNKASRQKLYEDLAQQIIDKEKLKFKVRITDQPGLENAHANPVTKEIVIDELHFEQMPDDLGGMIYILSHEMGHIVTDTEAEKNNLNVDERQNEADAFAGRVCAHMGLSLDQTLWVLRDFRHHYPDQSKELNERIRRATEGWKQRDQEQTELPDEDEIQQQQAEQPK